MTTRFWQGIRLVAIGKRWPHHEDQHGTGDRAAYFSFLWKHASALISERIASPLLPHALTPSNA